MKKLTINITEIEGGLTLTISNNEIHDPKAIAYMITDLLPELIRKLTKILSRGKREFELELISEATQSLNSGSTAIANSSKE